MKLGALQYYFRTWEDLLRSLVGVIDSEIKAEWRSQGLDEDATVYDIAAFMLDGSSVTRRDLAWRQTVAAVVGDGRG